MKLKQIVFVIACLIVCNAKAQNRKPIPVPPNLEKYLVKGLPDLFVGDKLPDVVIPKIMGWHKKIANPAEFKDKLLILDFWGTTCASCIDAFPKMKALQDYYGSKIMILPVTSETEGKVNSVIKQYKVHPNPEVQNRGKWLSFLPSVVEDKNFNTYFKHATAPHEVWIYKGKVIGITDAEYVDEKNIDAVLRGQLPFLPLKYDFYEFDETKPLFQMNQKQADSNDKKLRYTAISGYKQDVEFMGSTNGSGLVRDTMNKRIRYYFINQNIFISYIQLFNSVKETEPLSFPTFAKSKVVWDVADRSKYRYVREESGYIYSWYMNRAICFETVQPDTGQSDADVYRTVLKDMNRLLGLNVHWEKRKETVYVIKDKPGVQFKGIADKNSRKGVPIEGIPEQWNVREDNPYLFDESTVPDSIKKNYLSHLYRIYLDSTELKNFDALKIKLALYGLDLVKEERWIDKLIFSEVVPVL